MENKKVAIRPSLVGNILLIIIFTIFTVGGIFLLKDEELMFLGIISIIFFGFGGLLYVLFMAWKPIAVISSEGIIVPYGWGKNFVTWEKVSRFEVIEQTIRVKNTSQTNKYIGIFVTDTEGIVGAGKFSKAISQMVTDWDEVPDLLINTSIPFIKTEKVMKILQEFYDEYRTVCQQ